MAVLPALARKVPISMRMLRSALLNMQPGKPAPQDSPAVAPHLHATTTFAGHSLATIAGLPADGATALWPIAGAEAIASDARPISERRLDNPNGAVAPPSSVAPGGSGPTPKRTSEHLSQNERSAKAPRMEDVHSFTPASTIDMAESNNNQLCEDLTTVESAPEIAEEILSKIRGLDPEIKNAMIEAGIKIEGDSSNNSRLAAGPSPSPIAEDPADGTRYPVPKFAQANSNLLDTPTSSGEDSGEDSISWITDEPADSATAFRPFAGEAAIASDTRPISARRSYKLDPWVAPPSSVAPGGSGPTPKRTSEHLFQNERSAKAPRMGNLPSVVLESTFDMAESSNDKLCDDLIAVEPLPTKLNSQEISEIMRDLIESGMGIGEDFSNNSPQVPGPSASPIAEQPTDGAIYLVPELAQENQKLLDEPTNFEEDFWEDYGDNSRLAAEPSAPRIAEQSADGATALRPVAGAGAIASDARPMSKRRRHIPHDGAVAPPASVAPDGSGPTPKRASEHLSQNERSAKAPRKENLPLSALDSTIDMAESSNDKLCDDLIADDLVAVTLSSQHMSEIMTDLIEIGMGIEEDSSNNSRLAAGPSADIQGLDTENPLVASSKARSPHPIIGQKWMEPSRHAVPASIAQARATSTLPREHKLPAPEKRQEETRLELGMNPSKPKSAFKLPEARQKEALGAKGLSIPAPETKRIDGKAANLRDISNQELLRFGRVYAVYGKDPHAKTWISDQLKQFTDHSYINFFTSEGYAQSENLINHIKDNIKTLSPTAQDMQDLSNFIKIQCKGSVPSFNLLCYCLLLNRSSMVRFVKINGELTTDGESEVAKLSKNSPPGRIKPLLKDLPVFQQTRVNLLDAPATSTIEMAESSKGKLERRTTVEPILYPPQNPILAQTALASVSQAASANPPSARLAPAATLPAGERLAAPGGNREINELIALARMWVSSNMKDLDCRPWIEEHTQSDIRSFDEFLTQTGQLQCELLIKYLNENGSMRSPTGRDLVDLSSFLQTRRTKNFALLCASVGLNPAATWDCMFASGELKGPGQRRVEKHRNTFGHSNEPGPVGLLLQGLQPPPDTHP